ncbi:hypothetical protein NB713_002262 [Xanthomonas sacchari]|nr:hypothetical protein [Xanthomonas sacchari]
MAAGVYAPGRVGARAPHHPGVRQHPAYGRAHRAAPGRTARHAGGGGPSRQPGARDPAARRAPAQGRRAAGAGGHRLAGTGPGHRRRRPGLPARLAAFDRRVPAARRPLRARGGRHAEGALVSAVARRPGRVRGLAGLRAPRRTGCAAHARCAAGRARPAARRRGGLPGVGGRRTLRAGAWRLAVCGVAARAVRRGAAHALRRLQHAAGAARRLPASRCGASPRAPAPRRADGGAHLRRHHPRDRRLQRGAGAAGADHRHGQRGFRGGEPGRRRVSARQRQLPHPARGSGAGTGGGRARRAAQHPVLDRRSARAQRCAVAGRVAAAGRSRAGAGAGRRGAGAAVAVRPAGAGRRRRAADRRLSEPRACGAGRLADPAVHRAGTLLRCHRRHPAGDPQRLRQPHQPRLGPGPAQALLPHLQFRVAGGRDRGRDRAVAVDPAQLRPGRGGALSARRVCAGRAGAGAAGRAAVRRALALERHQRAGAAALHRRAQGRAATAADEVRGSAGHGVSRPGGLRGEPGRRARDSRAPAGGADPARLPGRGDGQRRLAAATARHRGRRGARAGARADRALAAGGRGARRAALCLSRRRAAGRTAHPGGAQSPLPGSAQRR